ncbi:hypothetical protein B9G69_012600 [Bdellovibrio sp. SKB1291214]|uniref:hypothetical protein n=1 Tax=Bdellovibrio sp. SKB1291214 TaxID=1732569 RepID=UPI00223F6182|nr:hypothetical protein [Bdellovibrio sp. SKB1291214]UYL07886.1 hypothetical protein B9G69_012600 [Bdellovibrio sp. SKB1291214]
MIAYTRFSDGPEVGGCEAMKKSSLLLLSLATLLWSQLALTAPLCAAVFTSAEPQLSLLQWDAQTALRKDFSKFTDLELLGFTYSSDKDALSYKSLADEYYAKLSSLEKSVLSDYTELSGREYEKMNANISKFLNNQSLKKKDAVAVQNLLGAFDKGLTLPQGFILFRGIDASSGIKFGKVGTMMKWDRLTSTSVNPEVARYFANDYNMERTYILVLEVAEPVRAIVAKDATEMEFIFAPRTRFQVVSRHIDRSENIQIIHLKVYPPLP